MTRGGNGRRRAPSYRYMCICMPFCLSACLSVYLSRYTNMYMFYIWMSIFLSICLSIYIYVYIIVSGERPQILCARTHTRADLRGRGRERVRKRALDPMGLLTGYNFIQVQVSHVYTGGARRRPVVRLVFRVLSRYTLQLTPTHPHVCKSEREG